MKSLLLVVILMSSVLPSITGKRLVCYFDQRASSRQVNGNFTLDRLDSRCTHLIFYTSENVIMQTDHVLVQKFKDLKLRNPTLKILVNSEELTALILSPLASLMLASVIPKAVSQFQQYHVDGLEISLENRSGNLGTKDAGFSQLLQEAKKGFSASGLLLSLLIWNQSFNDINLHYDVGVIGKVVDFVNIPGFDFSDPVRSPAIASHHANLLPSTRDNKNSVDNIVTTWLSNGFPPAKINLGLPLYGKSWKLRIPSDVGTGVGPGEAGSFTSTAGHLSYYEICHNIRTKGWKKTQDREKNSGPWAVSPTTSNSTWVGYDDPSIMVSKVKYLNQKGLGGAMVWDVSQDDWMNLCGCGTNPLIAAISNTLEGIDTNNTNCDSFSSQSSSLNIPSNLFVLLLASFLSFFF